MSTSTTTLELPLTYYGPSVCASSFLFMCSSRVRVVRSKCTVEPGEAVRCHDIIWLPLYIFRNLILINLQIPLGTNGAWTWGGLYPPSSGPSSTATPTPVPSSFTATSTSFPSFRLSSSIVPINTSTSVSTPTVVASGAGSNLSKSALIGIIFGGIVGAIALFLLLACFIRWRVQRNRNGYRPTPIWTHWEVVSPSGPRSTNEDRHTGVGSPRGSGEEADSFLHHSQSGTQYRGSTVHPIASLPPGAAPPAFGTTSSGDSGHTSSSAVTDYGVLLPDGGRIGQAYAQEHDSYFLAARPSSEMAGHIIAPGELLRLDDEEEPQGPPRMYGVSSASDSDSLLPPFASLSPPPMSDGEKNSTRKTPSVTEKDKSLRSLSVPASDMEASEVFTARRVRVQDVGITSPGTDETSSHSHLEASLVAGPSGWRDSFRLSSIQRLRLSWFGSSSRNSRSSNSRSRSDDVESSQSLLQPPRRRHHSRLQLVITDDRPISTLSSKSAISGNTVYHDASSRLGTPVSVPSRAMTPATGGGAIPGGDVSPLPIGAPPAYALEDPYSSVSSRVRIPCSQAEDVLDLPVPAPASQFTASGGAGRGSAVVGLDGRSQSRTYCDSLSVITGSPNEVGITIDVLDAAPPVAGEGWRAMAGGFGSSRAQEGEERATSGTVSALFGRYTNELNAFQPNHSLSSSVSSK